MLTMTLVISILMGLVPFLGIAWTIATGTIKTVDGLFMSLILLALSATFLLNAYWELRDRGMLAFLRRKRRTPSPKAGGSPPDSSGSEG